MDPKAEDYRPRAEEAEAVARMESDEKQRAEWEKIAHQWRVLVQQAEQLRG